ncbi:MAG: hypothetical protein VB021_08585 [Oscillospiraceae bacterium]|nr:hypothetical protein [Oscillospiraceae bacterium]
MGIKEVLAAAKEAASKTSAKTSAAEAAAKTAAETAAKQAAAKVASEKAAAERAAVAKAAAAKAAAAAVAAKAAATAAAAKKSVDDLAKEVIHGDWGNGQERKDRLAAAGYDFSSVQDRVNQLLKTGGVAGGKSVEEIAREVIRGDWGNGQERKDRLAAAGYDYGTIQGKVNELLK